MSQYFNNANAVLGCINRGTESRSIDALGPLYVYFVKSHLDSFVSHFKKNMEKLEYVQRRAKKIINNLEIKPFSELLRDLGMFSENTRRQTADVIDIFKYLKGCHVEDEGSVFFTAPESMAQTNGFKLQEIRC